jgi:hypothetical protein
LTLGRFVAGCSARAKARRLGLTEEWHEAEEREKAAAIKPNETVRPLAPEIPVWIFLSDN